jgi:glycosyltransferase involved in cell wall biosynthesis
MKISIITVSYNSEATIEFAIKSVLSQTYKNIEYIIVDGGSKDSTPNIVRSFGNRIHVFVSEPDKGIYDAMNKGIRLATGDVIGILNSDDLYADNEVISDVMSGFSQNPSVDMLYGNLVYVKKDDTDKIVRKWDSRPYYAGFFEAGNVPPHTSLFLKRNVFDIVGVFNLQYKIPFPIRVY